MDYKEFEAATAALYQALGQGNGITIEGYGARCRVVGRSGARHQVDVLAKQSNGLQTIRTAVECKYWQKKVGQEVVAKLATVIDDANIEKGAIVSKEGFTSGAIVLAKEHNISLVEMREPNDKDWEGKIKTVHITLYMDCPEFYDIEFIQPPDQTGQVINGAFAGRDIAIVEPGKQSNTLDTILNNAVSTVTTTGQPIEVKFPRGTTIQISGYDKHGRVDALRFKVRHITTKNDIVIDGAETIWLIVKEVFEGRQFNIERDGRIREISDTEL